ncbi:MAG: hypothetical protein ACO3EH_00350 [Ilumatobacteraceae bacterium]
MTKTIKSIPAHDLELVAFIHVFKVENNDPQSESSAAFTTETELDVLNAQLRESAQFDRERGGLRCDCCGHALSYACEVVHKPTLTGYFVGRDCATTIESLSRYNFGGLSVAAAHRAKARQNVASWKTRNPQHREILEWALTPEAHHIARDIAGKVARYKDISDKQVQLLYRLRQQQAERDAAKAAEPQPTTPAPVGRADVSGTVLTVRSQESAFGTTRKALIRLTDHNKVWVSVPSSSSFQRGWTVTIRATWERSEKDEHFSFGSRPHLVAEQEPVQSPA